MTIVYRRSREEMPAFGHEVEQALCEGVKMIYLAAPLEVVIGADGKVVGLICQKMELGEPDASGRRKPVPIPDETFELPVDMIVPAIGQEAAQSALEACGVKLSRWGTIEVDETTYETSRPGSSRRATCTPAPGSQWRRWAAASRPPSPSTDT